MHPDYARQIWRDLEPVSVRRALDAQAARLFDSDEDLAAMVRRIRDRALRAAGESPR